jgi:hypothetical protein
LLFGGELSDRLLILGDRLTVCLLLFCHPL